MSRMMSGKRKHGEDVFVAGKTKRFKQNYKSSERPQPTRAHLPSKANGQTNTNINKKAKSKKKLKTLEPITTSTNDQIDQKKKENLKKKTKKPKPFHKKLEKNTSANSKGNDKARDATGKKIKLWKRWQKIKKQNKKRSLVKTDANNSVPLKKNENDKLLKTNEDLSKKSEVQKAVSITSQPELASCNWKKLKMDLKPTKKKKNLKHKAFKKKNEKEAEKKDDSVEPDIWFDDVDEELLKPKQAAPDKAKHTNRAADKMTKSETTLVKDHAFKGPTKAVALDCEMVGVGEAGKESVLARVSVVNQFGECLYDTFVRSREDVVDYRTRWSGVTPEKLQDAADFLDAQKAVSDILRGRILVGHAVHHDLKVLFLDHPRKDIRDTSRYKPYRELFKGRTPSLKNLTSRLLSVKIQTGEHNSVTDAQAAMRLYTFSRQEWEKHRRKTKINKTKTPKEKTKK